MDPPLKELAALNLQIPNFDGFPDHLHVAVVGGTGNGKSAFICAMLKQLGAYYDSIPLSHMYKKIKIGEVESNRFIHCETHIFVATIEHC